jgi:hypothetical protein
MHSELLDKAWQPISEADALNLIASANWVIDRYSGEDRYLHHYNRQCFLLKKLPEGTWHIPRYQAKE